MITFEPGLVVTARHTYNSNVSEDLAFEIGEKILVTEEVNAEWLRGQIGADRNGIFPKNFVERHGFQIANVAFDFKAEYGEDLGVQSGQQVLVVKYIDSSWVNAQNKSGLSGNVPLNFLKDFDVISDFYHVEPASSLVGDNGYPKYRPDERVRATDVSDIHSFGLNNFGLASSVKQLSAGQSEKRRGSIVAATPSWSETETVNLNCYQSQNDSNYGNGFALRKAKSSFFRDSGFEDSIQQSGGNEQTSLTRSSSNPDINDDGSIGANATSLRANAFNELIATEKIYLKDINIFMKAFPPGDYRWESLNIPYRKLCCNLGEIQELSTSLVAEFERAKLARENFGGIMLANCDKVTTAYTTYCTNFEKVPKLLEDLSLNKSIKSYFETGIETMKRNGSKILNMNSFLLQPIQRVMRYPLLFMEIFKLTPESHSDNSNLREAVVKLQQIVETINQTKRTKEVLDKYTKIEPNNFKNVISKFNIHSFKKKSNRLSQTVSRKISSKHVEDLDFETYRTNFKNVEKCVQSVHGSVLSYNHTLAAFTNSIQSMLNELSSLLLEDFRNNAMFNEYFTLYHRLKTLSNQHVTEIDANVAKRLEKLLNLFSAPGHLIKKRDDKLLDYESLLTEKDAEHELAGDALYTAKGNYNALNDQLKCELPHFNDLLWKSIYDIILFLLIARRNFVKKYTTAFATYDANHLTSISGSHQSFKAVFERKHRAIVTEICTNVSFIPDTFSTLIQGDSSGPSNLAHTSAESTQSLNRKPKSALAVKGGNVSHGSGQSEKAKEKVRSKYSRQDLYTCKSNIKNGKPLHLSLKTGDLVGVHHRKDPSGNEKVWYVDNGTESGLVDALFLTPVFPTVPMEENNHVALRQKLSVGSQESRRARPMSVFSAGEVFRDFGFSSNEAPTPNNVDVNFDLMSSSTAQKHDGAILPTSKTQQAKSRRPMSMFGDSMLLPQKQNVNKIEISAPMPLVETRSSSEIGHPNHSVNQRSPDLLDFGSQSWQDTSSGSRLAESLSLFDPLNSNSNQSSISQNKTNIGNNLTSSRSYSSSMASLDQSYPPVASIKLNVRKNATAESNYIANVPSPEHRQLHHPKVDQPQQKTIPVSDSNPNPRAIAMWTHNASTQGEISLVEGMNVEILRKSDMSGNDEWWLVKHPITSSEGYFPANYLQLL